MLITKISMLTGKVHTLDLPVTKKQLDQLERREGLVQDIFPRLTPDQREFLMTGSTSEEWDAAFKEDEGDCSSDRNVYPEPEDDEIAF